MSKFLKVPNGNYKIEVQDGGLITLDTGADLGTVVITGDLQVLGTSTFIESTNLEVKDNIIVVNDGETGGAPGGITLREAGMRMDRGERLASGFNDAFFVFNEDRVWLDPILGSTRSGAFEFKDSTGGYVGIRTNSITTGGGDLFLINNGTGVLSVTGTNNYERQVFTYDGPDTIDLLGGPQGTGVQDDDHIPNTKAIVDYINSYFAGIFQDRIEEGVVTKTFVETLDDEETGSPSLVQFGVNDNVVAEFYEQRVELNNIRIEGSKLSAIDSNQNLVLSAPGTGTVQIRDVLEIRNQPTVDDPSLEPAIPNDGLRLYVSDRNYGGSGLFFVHDDTTRDEIISKNRTIVYSMIF